MTLLLRKDTERQNFKVVRMPERVLEQIAKTFGPLFKHLAYILGNDTLVIIIFPPPYMGFFGLKKYLR